jgi:hypothetical protein
MTTLNLDLYEALKEAKVSDAKARAAAEAVADVGRVAAEQADVKGDLKQLKSDVQDLKVQGQDMRGRMLLLQWMLGFNLAATMGVLWKLLK